MTQVAAQSKAMSSDLREKCNNQLEQELVKLGLIERKEWEKEKEERVERLNKRYLRALKHIGEGIEKAKLQPNELEEFRQRQARSVAEGRRRGAAAGRVARQSREEDEKRKKAAMAARNHSRYVEKMRAMRIAAMSPPAPPEPPPHVKWANEYKKKQLSQRGSNSLEEDDVQRPVVERLDPLKQLDGKEEAEKKREQEQKVEEERRKQEEARRKIAEERGRQALRRERVHLDYQQLLKELEDWAKHDVPLDTNVITPLSEVKRRHRRLEDQFERDYLSAVDRDAPDLSQLVDLENRVPECEVQLAEDATDGPPQLLRPETESTPSNDMLDGADVLNLRNPHMGISTTESSGWEMVDKKEYEEQRRLIQMRHDVPVDSRRRLEDFQESDEEYLIIEQDGDEYRFHTASSSEVDYIEKNLQQKKNAERPLSPIRQDLQSSRSTLHSDINENFETSTRIEAAPIDLSKELGRLNTTEYLAGQMDLSKELKRLNSTEYLSAPFGLGVPPERRPRTRVKSVSLQDLDEAVSKIQRQRKEMDVSINRLTQRWNADPNRSALMRRCVAKLLTLTREQAKLMASSTSSESTPLSQLSYISARSLPSGTESFLSYAREYDVAYKNQNEADYNVTQSNTRSHPVRKESLTDTRNLSMKTHQYSVKAATDTQQPNAQTRVEAKRRQYVEGNTAKISSLSRHPLREPWNVPPTEVNVERTSHEESRFRQLDVLRDPTKEDVESDVSRGQLTTDAYAHQDTLLEEVEGKWKQRATFDGIEDYTRRLRAIIDSGSETDVSRGLFTPENLSSLNVQDDLTLEINRLKQDFNDIYRNPTELEGTQMQTFAINNGMQPPRAAFTDSGSETDVSRGRLTPETTNSNEYFHRRSKQENKVAMDPKAKSEVARISAEISNRIYRDGSGVPGSFSDVVPKGTSNGTREPWDGVSKNYKSSSEASSSAALNDLIKDYKKRLLDVFAYPTRGNFSEELRSRIDGGSVIQRKPAHRGMHGEKEEDGGDFLPRVWRGRSSKTIQTKTLDRRKGDSSSEDDVSHGRLSPEEQAYPRSSGYSQKRIETTSVHGKAEGNRGVDQSVPSEVDVNPRLTNLGDGSAGDITYDGLKRLLRDLQNNPSFFESPGARESFSNGSISTPSSLKLATVSKSFQFDDLIGHSAYGFSSLSIDSVSSCDSDS